MGKIIFDELFAGWGHTSIGDREGGGSARVRRPQNGLREAFPACFNHSNRAGNLFPFSGLKRNRRQENGQIRAKN